VRAVRPWRAGLALPADLSGGPETTDRLQRVEVAELVELVEVPDPVPGAGEVLISIRATALNRADLLQLRGAYPPPPGESEVPGLEAAGVIAALGPGVVGPRVGDEVAALLAGGGHAELVAAPVGQTLPRPPGWSWEQAAALPEGALTAWTNLVAEGGLAAGETVLVAGATGGMGTSMVQLGAELGARVLAAARDPERLERLRPLGASETLRLDDDLPDRVRRATGGRGADLAIDLVGGPHLPRLLRALAERGRLVVVGLMAGREASIDLGLLLRRRLQIVGSVLRPRPRVEKARLVAEFFAFAAPALAAGRLAPIVDRVYAFDRIGEAYGHLDRGRPFGKVVVRGAPDPARAQAEGGGSAAGVQPSS
jgi:putative PIG3 family NAD(P)H quinone oxidoreductase